MSSFLDNRAALSPNEAAKALSISRATLYRMAQRGSLRMVKLAGSGRTVVPVSEIQRLLAVEPVREAA